MATKTVEEIEKLKEGWKKDPCWDIEDTEGFEDHRNELVLWRIEYEAQCEASHQERVKARRETVMEVTGVGMADAGILDSLYTWEEIEQNVLGQKNYMGDFSHYEVMMAELAQEQIRATLLQAAQLKRIADALERMDDDNSVITSAKIWGSEQ